MNSRQTMNSVEELFIKLAPWLIVVAAILLVVTIARIDNTSEAVKETSAYTRVSNCIVAKSAYLPIKERDIETCYVQVEQDTDIPLKRFDNEK